MTAPFDAVVASETVAIGQSVSPQNETARLVGVDRLHVHTMVPVKHLPLIGVLFVTVIALILVPCAYIVIDDLQRAMTRASTRQCIN